MVMFGFFFGTGFGWKCNAINSDDEVSMVI